MGVALLIYMYTNGLLFLRIKREERIERQQEQLRRKANDMDEWRRELTVFRGEVRLPFYVQK